jgi:hypothetical protein
MWAPRHFVTSGDVTLFRKAGLLTQYIHIQRQEISHMQADKEGFLNPKYLQRFPDTSFYCKHALPTNKIYRL